MRDGRCDLDSFALGTVIENHRRPIMVRSLFFLRLNAGIFFIDTSNDEIVGDVATNEARAFLMPHIVVDMIVQTEDGAVAQVLGSPADDPCWNGPCWGDTDTSADDMYSDNSDSIVTDDKALWTASELQTSSMASQDIRHNRGGELYVSNWDTRGGDEWYLDLERTLSPTWDVSAQVIEILNAAFVFSVGLLLVRQLPLAI